MAKPPSKRRGITLDPWADTAGPLIQSTDQSPGAGVAAPELVEQLQRMSAEQEARWQQQEAQLRQQLASLQEQIARQARPRTARVGVLLALLSLSGIGALGYHLWPRLQGVTGDLSRVSTDVGRISPELQAIREQVASLNSGMGQVVGTMSSVKAEVSTVRSDLGSLRRTVDELPTEEKPAQVGNSATGSKVQALPRSASIANDPFVRVHRPLPW